MGYADENGIFELDIFLLASGLLPKITEYFEDPVHQQEFEAWKKNRERSREGGNVIPLSVRK